MKKWAVLAIVLVMVAIITIPVQAGEIVPTPPVIGTARPDWGWLHHESVGVGDSSWDREMPCPAIEAHLREHHPGDWATGCGYGPQPTDTPEPSPTPVPTSTLPSLGEDLPPTGGGEKDEITLAEFFAIILVLCLVGAIVFGLIYLGRIKDY